MEGSKRTASIENHLAAVRFATSNLERVVAHAVLRTPPERRREVFHCLMQLYVKWVEEVVDCAPATEDSGDGPDCKDGWIPVGDDCIPPPTGGG
jgi:hypothetical protein